MIISRLEKVVTIVIRLFIAIIILAFFVTDAGSDTIQHYCETAKQRCISLQQTLQGRWILDAWKTDAKGSKFQPVIAGSTTFKLYHQDQFYYFSYGSNGNLFESYGGTYAITGPASIAETITFYAPYDRRKIAYGAKGQMVVVHGTSMVGAITEITLSFDVSAMIQEGIVNQRIPEGEDMNMFGPRAMTQSYHRALSDIEGPK